MSQLRRWMMKMVTGLAAFLLVAWQTLASVPLPHSFMSSSAYQTNWTNQGIRTTLLLEDQRQVALLEGEVREEHIRTDRQSDHKRRGTGKAAS